MSVLVIVGKRWYIMCLYMVAYRCVTVRDQFFAVGTTTVTREARASRGGQHDSCMFSMILFDLLCFGFISFEFLWFPCDVYDCFSFPIISFSLFYRFLEMSFEFFWFLLFWSGSLPVALSRKLREAMSSYLTLSTSVPWWCRKIKKNCASTLRWKKSLTCWFF